MLENNVDIAAAKNACVLQKDALQVGLHCSIIDDKTCNREEQIKMRILTISLICITPVLADDLKTVDGKEYKNTTATRVVGEGAV